MAVAERLARQLGQPSGLAGRAVGHILNRANRTINRKAMDRLDLAGSESVLEIGFGGGVALAGILARTDGFVAGIEISEAMLESCSRRFRRELERGRLQLEKGG